MIANRPPLSVSLLKSGVSAVALLVVSVPALAQQEWGVAATDVTPDPAVRYGVLPNGMKYAIMHNETPKGAASVRLHFNFGSIGEADDERGLAHFIEHMAFNGTTNVPEGEMVKLLERQGLAFGPDTNAYTGFDVTAYILELPKADEERIDTALFLMREVASEIKFDSESVDRERGVIVGERRARDNFGLRQVMDRLGFLVPDTPYADRFPIGTDEVLTTAPADRLKALYQRYYRPENATLIVVGDIDAHDIEAKVKMAFSDWRATGPAGARLPRGSVDLDRTFAIGTFVDPAVPTGASITVMRPWDDPADTQAERRANLVRSIANGMFDRRIQRIANAPDSVILGGGMGDSEWKDAALYTSVTVVAKDGEWRSALEVAEQEVRRATTHGFTAREFATEKSETDTSYRTAAEQASTRRNTDIAQAIISVIDEDSFMTTPEFRYEFYRQVAPTITLDEVNTAFRALWMGSQPLTHVSDKSPLEGGEDAVLAALDASRMLAVAAPAEGEMAEFAYSDFGPVGTIVADERIEDLGIRTIRFANNVLLNLKRTDFENGKVRYRVRVGGGELALPADQPGLAFMINNISSVGGLEAHSLEELKEITAGQSLNYGLIAANDAFLAQGDVSPQDLAMQMKLSAAYVTAPGFRPEAGAQWSNLVPLIDAQLQAIPQNVAFTKGTIVIADDDPRFGIPPGEILSQRTLAQYRAAFTRAVADAPIEISIVGDFDEAAAIAAVAQSFGALPPRALDMPDYDEQRRANFRSDLAPVTLTHTGAADQAVVMSAWATDDDDDYERVVGVGMLREILKLMLTEELREQLGATYGASISSNMSSTYADFGYLSVMSVVAPDKVAEVQEAIDKVTAQLREGAVDDDLMRRALNPTLESIDRSLRENSYWLDVIDEAQTDPENLERARIRRERYIAVTPERIQELGRLYLKPEGRLWIRIFSDKWKEGGN